MPASASLRSAAAGAGRGRGARSRPGGADADRHRQRSKQKSAVAGPAVSCFKRVSQRRHHKQKLEPPKVTRGPVYGPVAIALLDANRARASPCASRPDARPAAARRAKCCAGAKGIARRGDGNTPGVPVVQPPTRVTRLRLRRSRRVATPSRSTQARDLKCGRSSECRCSRGRPTSPSSTRPRFSCQRPSGRRQRSRCSPVAPPRVCWLRRSRSLECCHARVAERQSAWPRIYRRRPGLRKRVRHRPIPDRPVV